MNIDIVFESEFGDINLEVDIHSIEPFEPAYRSGHIDRWSPSAGGEIDFSIVDASPAGKNSHKISFKEFRGLVRKSKSSLNGLHRTALRLLDQDYTAKEGEYLFDLIEKQLAKEHREGMEI